MFFNSLFSRFYVKWNCVKNSTHNKILTFPAQILGTPHPLEIQTVNNSRQPRLKYCKHVKPTRHTIAWFSQQLHNLQLVNSEGILQTNIARWQSIWCFQHNLFHHPHKSPCPVFQKRPPTHLISSLTGFWSAAYPSHISWCTHPPIDSLRASEYASLSSSSQF